MVVALIELCSDNLLFSCREEQSFLFQSHNIISLRIFDISDLYSLLLAPTDMRLPPGQSCLSWRDERHWSI